MKSTEVDVDSIVDECDRRKQSRSPLIVVDNGEDVVFNMRGKLSVWTGTRTSEMSLDHDGRQILKWVVKINSQEGKHPEAIEIIRDQLEASLCIGG